MDSAPRTTPSRRQRQRDALGRLLHLSAESAATEHKLEQDRGDADRRANRQWSAAQQTMRERYDKSRFIARRRRKEELDKLAAAAGKALAQIDAEAAAERAGLKDKLRKKARRVEKELQDEKWLAEGVRDADATRAQDAHEKAVKAADKDAEALDHDEAAAAELCRRWGRALPDAEPAAAAAAADWDARRDAVTGDLARLRRMFLPKLLEGATPWVLLVILVAAAAGVAHYLHVGDPALALRTTPDAAVVGGAAGATAVALILLGVLLKRRANANVDAAAKRFSDDLAAARGALAARRVAADRDRTDALAAAAKAYEDELVAADRTFGPKLQAVDKEWRQGDKDLAARTADRRRAAEAEQAKERGEAEGRWQAKLDEIDQTHEADLLPHRQLFEQITGDAAEAYETGRADLESEWDNALRITREMADEDRPEDAAIADWRSWRPPETFAPTVRLGELNVDMEAQSGGDGGAAHNLPVPLPYDVPALLAFPDDANLLLRHEPDGRDAAIDLLRLAMLRLLTSLPPGRVRFTLVDPVGLGRSFAGFMHLADYDDDLVGGRVLTEAEAIEQKLTDLTEHMETVIQKYLRNEFETIDAYNAQAGELAEPYRFLVISDLPTGFSEDALRRLASIAASGPRCGVHVLAALDTRQTPAGGGTFVDDVARHATVLQHDPDAGRFAWDDEVFGRFPLALDAAPGDAALTDVLRIVGEAARAAKRVEVPFESITPDDGELWSLDSARELRVPVGRTGATRLQQFSLGKGVAQHALVAGKTGSGKSTLLNGLITNLALWYAPDQLELYLIDFKRGVEFKAYATRRLPHARAVAVESDREFGLSVLQRLDEELGRRGELFRDAGVQDVAGFRRARPGQAMPRILLIVDEFQELFSDDDKLSQDAALLIDRLVRQGRAFGMHVVLGSQTIGGAAGLARSTLGQVAVRVALQTGEADSRLILGESNTAARLLSRPGEAILNDANGEVEANSPFQVAWLPDADRDRLLQKVREKAENEGVKTPPPVVFEGNAPADLADNGELAAARAGDPPRRSVAYLGEPVAIKAPTHVAFRRQAGANLLVVGQQEEFAAALVAGGVASLAATCPVPPRFVVLDGTPADAETAGLLRKVVDDAGVEADFADYRAVPDAMADLAEELRGRLDGGDDKRPIFLIVHHLHRFRMFKREDAFAAPPTSSSGGGFASILGGGGEGEDGDAGPATAVVSPAAALSDVLRDGPPVGLHVLATIDTLANIERRLSREDLREFDARVLFQMGANDSGALIDSPAANRLGFYRALLASEEAGTQEKFRPYRLPDLGG